MKKFLVLIFSLFVSMPAMAYQNYILMADKPITNIQISNDEVLKVEPISSTKGKGTSMMIIPRTVGATRLSFCKGRKKMHLCVSISEDKTYIKSKNGIKLVPVDLPVELKK